MNKLHFVSKKGLLTAALLLITCFAFTLPGLAQEKNQTKGDKIFTSVEHSAGYKGGIEAFYQYLSKTIHYPAVARENKVTGKVILTFIIEKNGSISNVTVLRGIGSGCDEEAVRALKESPKWNPGTQNGKAVRQQYTVPVSFSLAKN